MGLLSDTLNLLLAWALGIAIVGGWGLGACRLLRLIGLSRIEKLPPPEAARDPRLGGAREPAALLKPSGVGPAGWWLGWAPLLVFLQAWHLALPVNALAWPVVVLVAAAGAVIGWRGLERWARYAVGRPFLAAAAVGVAVVLAVFVANRGAVPQEVPVAWEPLVQLGRQWALPIGIGNLSPPLGLNHAWTLVAALFSVGTWSTIPGEAATGLIALPLAVAALYGLSDTVASIFARRRASGPPATNKGEQVAAFYNAGGLILLAAWLAGPGLHTPLPGFAAGAFLFVACGQVVRGASSLLSPHRGERIDRLTVAVLLCSSACIAHPPAAFAALLPGAWAAWCLLATDRALLTARRATRSMGVDHRRQPGAAARTGTVIVAGVFLLVGAGLWLARSVIATGRPAYPFPGPSLPVVWAVPPGHRRALGELLGAGEMLARIAGQLGPVLVPALLGIAVWLAWLVRGGILSRQRQLAPLPLMLAIGLVGGLLLPGPGSALAMNAAVASTLVAAGLAVFATGTGQGGRVEARRHPRFMLVTVLFTTAVVASVTIWSPSLVGPEPLAPSEAAFSPEGGMRAWQSTWQAEVAVPAADLAETVKEGLPGVSPMPAAVEPPLDALRERSPGEPAAGYVIDRRDPRQVVW